MALIDELDADAIREIMIMLSNSIPDTASIVIQVQSCVGFSSVPIVLNTFSHTRICSFRTATGSKATRKCSVWS